MNPPTAVQVNLILKFNKPVHNNEVICKLSNCRCALVKVFLCATIHFRKHITDFHLVQLNVIKAFYFKNINPRQTKKTKEQ